MPMWTLLDPGQHVAERDFSSLIEPDHHTSSVAPAFQPGHVPDKGAAATSDDNYAFAWGAGPATEPTLCGAVFVVWREPP
jgi:hypothetical protein